MNAFITVVVLAAIAVGVNSQSTGKTTRYWDCCKASCSWGDKASVTSPVKACDKDGVTALDKNCRNICNGGGTDPPCYMCNSNQPYTVNNSLSFGFVAGAVAGLTESQWCCACYEITFTSTAVSGKKMVVQVTNTGGDLGSNHFDIQIPGGGVGIFNGCDKQWGAPADGWGSRYGGISSASDCSQLPSALQSGCNWRFGWFQNADNPTMNLRRVQCPKSIIAKTGCQRTDDSSVTEKGYANL